ncbi:hypothetical protein EVAR_25755_1 [Eumeta japonica]|uniref:Uncharacterized protein n=1 Tax=Eumeta variegata TaxID=151549 RepID=A0A4C1V866_EUMVA|nr:hypothetical protein EVAR_25755_1 [Eumeta japonica]
MWFHLSPTAEKDYNDWTHAVRIIGFCLRYVVILLRVYWREVTRARRTTSADWWITPGTAGMGPRDLFTTSRDYRESVGMTSAVYAGTPRAAAVTRRARGASPRNTQHPQTASGLSMTA